MDASITPQELQALLETESSPTIIDLRNESVFRSAPEMLAGAVRRDPETVTSWAGKLPTAHIIVYCAHGQQGSQEAADALRKCGLTVRFVEGGLDGLRRAGFECIRKPEGASTRWVTRERPKVDRIACPWLILRFIDRNAEFLYVATAQVQKVAADESAIPYDIPGVPFSHDGDQCSFDAFIKRYRMTDPALLQLAEIVRGADTGRMDLSPQAAGLAALSLGLSRLIADDHAMLRQGMVMYDALYLWCKEGQEERHTWNPPVGTPS